MVEYDPVSNSSGMKNAIKCAENVLLDKIVSASDGYVGVCFYNTKQRRNPSDFDSVYIYADLDVPDPQTIIGLEEIVSSPSPLPPFGSSREAPSATAGFAELTDALWTCSTMFSGARTAAMKSGGRVLSQRIFLFTNNSTPFPGDRPGGRTESVLDPDCLHGGGWPSLSSEASSTVPASSSTTSSQQQQPSSLNNSNTEVFRARERCLQKAKDLAGFGVKIELFAMEKSMSQSDSHAKYGSSIVENKDDIVDDDDSKGSLKFSGSSAGLGSSASWSFFGSAGGSYGDGDGDNGKQGAKIDEKLADVQGTRFPPDAFYCKLLVANGDAGAKDGVSSIAKVRDLKERAWCKEHKKRTIGRVPLLIGADDSTAVEIGVQLYALCRRATKGTALKLAAATNQELASETQWVSKETGARVFPGQLRYACNYGGAQVAFTEEEVQQRIRSLPDPRGACIRVLGFKASAAIKPYMNHKPAVFAYPDEEMVKGSTVAFTALLEQMVALDRVAIARFKPRPVSAPALVALVPQIGEVLDTGVEEPTGFYMVYLPYADDIRDIQPQHEKDEEESGSGSIYAAFGGTEHKKELAKRVVRLLNIDFSSRDFPNPALQKHYAHLKAFALKTEPDPVPDLLNPDREGMARHSFALYALANVVYPPGYVPCLPSAGKRPGSGGSGGSGGGAPARKKICADSLATKIDWVVAVQEGSVAKARVSDLKDFLVIHGVKVPAKAKKEDLLALVIEYVGDHKDELNNEPPSSPS